MTIPVGKMGPQTLFDKSFLQMLSADEAAIFDCLFSATIAPIFYAEVLGNLAKEELGSPEGFVAGLARKTPIMHSTAHPLHASLVTAELTGSMPINMNGSPYRAGGRAKRDASGNVSILYDNAPEAEAFDRWQDEKFESLERDFAAAWRAQLKASDHATAAKLFKSVLKITDEPKNYEQAFAIAQKVVAGEGQRFLTLKTAYALLGLVPRDFIQIARRWKEAGGPALPVYAPYTAHCLLVDIFFHVCIDKKLISPDRSSNRIDIAYLYYLPFCRLFVSNDRLHRNVATLFMRPDQQYVSGADLKADLTKLDAHFSGLPEENRKQGLFRLAARPPDDDAFLTTRLWKTYGWQTSRSQDATEAKVEKSAAELLTKMKELNRTATSPIRPGDFERANEMVIKRKFPRKLGKWNILPDGFKGFEE